jgi:cytochrome c-type biogenesis protein CcmH/NrfG
MQTKNQKKKSASQMVKISKKKKSEILFATDWFILLLFFISTLIVYSNSFEVPFQFDDHNQISYREWYHSLDFFSHFSNWVKINERPVSFFTIALNYVLHGEKVFGYHLMNFFIHLLSGITLFYWLKILPVFKKEEEKSRWVVISITLFFLLHPAQTQSVTYIIQRMTSISGMFLILSVLLYTRGRFNHLENNRLIRVVPYYIFSIVAGVFAVYSKQNAIIFPLVLLLVELFFVRTQEGKICRKYLIVASISGLILLILAFIKFGLPAETHDISRMQYLATQMIVIPRYLQIMLFPVGLSIDHGVEIVDNFLNVFTILGAIFLLSVIAFALFMVKKEPLISFGIFWIFITLAVESSILPITDPMFDQRMYLPLVGFSIVIWSILNRYVFKVKKHLIKPVIISVLLLLSIMTIARNNVWKSHVAIWEDVTEKYPNYLRGWMALGKMYREGEQKNILKSIQCFEKARNIDPGNEENLLDLGFSYLESSQEEKAIPCYEKLQLSKDKTKRDQALSVLSAYHASRGNTDLARQFLNESITDDPSNNQAWKSLYSIYFEKKDFGKTMEISMKWLNENPNNADANFYLGKTYFYLNERETARKYLLKAIELDPRHAESMMLYANTCVNQFDYDEAISYLEKAYLLNKNSKIPDNIALIRQLKIKNPRPN